MHPLTLNSRQILIVQLPDGAKNVIIDIEGKISCITKTDYLGGEMLKIDLPPGRYNLLFLSSQATEEDCKGVVEITKDEFGWADYTKGQFYYDTALESFASLLSSLGVTGSAAVLEKVK